MTMVELPDAIDPDAPHVEFRMNQCRECLAAGPVALAQNPVWWQWGNQHHDETGHTKIYQYTLTRNTGQISTVGAARKARRALGARGQ
jgi:hypothetical protein